MEAKSGAKIAIRGKGSVKEGKGRNDPAANATIDEDLHCLVMADTEDKVNEAIRLIEDIIATVSSPNLFLTQKLITQGRINSRKPEQDETWSAERTCFSERYSA